MAKKGKAKGGADKSAGGSEGNSKKLLIIIVLAVIVIVGGGAGAAFFLLGGDLLNNVGTGSRAESAGASKTVKGKPRYVDLNPDFTVSMDDDQNRRFVLIALSVLTHYDSTEVAIRDNMPIIRNNIILMIGRKSTDELATQGGKDKLQREILTEVNRVIEENSNSSVMDIEQVYFTKFLMQ